VETTTLERVADACDAVAEQALDSAEHLLDAAGVPDDTVRDWVAVWVDEHEQAHYLHAALGTSEPQAREQTWEWWRQWVAQAHPDNAPESNPTPAHHAAHAAWNRAGCPMWPVQEYACELQQAGRHAEAQRRLETALEGARERLGSAERAALKAHLQAMRRPLDVPTQRAYATAVYRQRDASLNCQTLQLLLWGVRGRGLREPAEFAQAA